jgi:hypothetical protein
VKLVAMPPTVARVDHPGFGVLNRSLEIKVYLQPEMYPCKEMSCFVFGTLIQLSDQCTCQIFCNTSNSNFELIWRNLSIFTTSIPICVVPKVFSFVQDVPANAVFIFGSLFPFLCCAVRICVCMCIFVCMLCSVFVLCCDRGKDSAAYRTSATVHADAI